MSSRERFMEAVEAIESSSQCTMDIAGKRMGVSRQRVEQLLKGGEYIYSALLKERRVIKNEIAMSRKELERETKLALHPPPACGTLQGYTKHRRRKEQACVPCLDANCEASKKRSEARRDRLRPNRRRYSPESRERRSASLKARYRKE